jgi:FHA domain
MPMCPAGHVSASTDYCDDCGAPMPATPTPDTPTPGGPTSGGPASQATPSPEASSAAATDAIERCASCGGTRSGRFCEECGHDSMLPAPAGPQPAAATAASVPHPAPDPAGSSTAGGWTATVRADHDWYEEMRERSGNDAAVLPFPRYCPERRFELAGTQMLIGRRNRARGVDPEIDLSGSPMDPGVSTLHAMLLPRASGGWDVVDLGSTNGTIVGERADPIPPSTPVPLADGDQIKIGAWTTITVSCGAVD